MHALRTVMVIIILLGSASATAASRVMLLELDGIIGPASKHFVIRGLDTAAEQGADLVIIKMNTPGGLDSSMRDIITAILASRVPVVSYVAPAGARAASAGTYILYASHIAAMAPATNLGAATPVQIGGGGLPSLPGQDDKSEQDQQDNDSENQQSDAKNPQSDVEPKTAMERKIINDARAYIRSLAQLRNRNIEWAEQAVREGASLSAEEALAQDVIDMIASDTADLLEQIQGHTVEIDGQPQVLALDNPVLETVEPDWRYRLLAIITHPQVAYILMLVGIYGLFFELSNPGALIPGVLGGICLLLALFAFQVLPINYAGLALIILGIAFIIAEAFMPSFGILGLGGVAAFIFGSLILWDEQQTGYEVPLALILGFAGASAVFFLTISGMAIRNRRRPVVSGDAALVGAQGQVLEDFSGQEGRVQIQGESWRAHCDQVLHKGQNVRIVSRDGLVLHVEPE